MDYKNATCILPKDLLLALQEYADGEYIYIPRKVENRKRWGERNQSRDLFANRNQEIFRLYQGGTSVEVLAGRYCLSAKTVYKILSAMKKCS